MLRLAIVIIPALAIGVTCYAISPFSTLLGIGIGLVLLAPVAAAAYISQRRPERPTLALPARSESVHDVVVIER